MIMELTADCLNPFRLIMSRLRLDVLMDGYVLTTTTNLQGDLTPNDISTRFMAAGNQ